MSEEGQIGEFMVRKAYTEALEELERLKAQHEEMLLKHAREQGVALDLLEAAMEEIERLKKLLRRAADAMEKWNYIDGHSVRDLHVEGLIAELRKAAQ